MLMGEFRSQRECWEALLAGKTLIDDRGSIRRLQAGNIVDRAGFPLETSFRDYECWSTYIEPKKMIKLAPALTQDFAGRYYITDPLYASEEQAKERCSAARFVRWLIDTHSVDVEE